MKYREIGAEDPLILYDKKEKNPKSEIRRYWSDILQLPQQVDSIGSQQ
ncbi:MAG: hypothetical protein WCF06_16655 [Nitrososphaeraceae archaeon]|jgi:hypothetical protein